MLLLLLLCRLRMLRCGLVGGLRMDGRTDVLLLVVVLLRQLLLLLMLLRLMLVLLLLLLKLLLLLQLEVFLDGHRNGNGDCLHFVAGIDESLEAMHYV